MALGTITRPTPNPDFTVSNKRWRTRDIQLTSGANYTTGGETVTAASVGLKGIQQVIIGSEARTASGTTGCTVAVDYTNAPSSVKLQAYFSVTTAADAEVSSNTNLSTFSVRATFVGF